MKNHFFAIVLLLAAAAAPVDAHDTWLIPDRFAAPPAALTLDLTSGMMFPALDTSILPGRIERARMRLAGRSYDITDFTSAPNSLRMKIAVQDPGVATIWVELKPKAIDLNAGQVLEYLEEIGAPESIRRPWESAETPQRWREIYTKHSKTFVRSGNPKSDNSWAEPVGMFLEIVPEKDPTTLRAGKDLTVRVLKDAKPLQDFPVGLVREGSPKSVMQKTDQRGRATFQVGAAGQWMLRATELRKASTPKTDWESDFTTLTFKTME